jgi:hypothetical protein
MKKKQLLLSLSLAITVLFSILMQSIHTYSHVVEQWSQTETECHHKYNVTHTEITHQHHAFEQCTVCHFSFGSYVTPLAFEYKFASNYNLIPHRSFSVQEVILFSGSLYSHRGPPSLVSSII